MNNPIDILVKYVGPNFNKVLDAWKEPHRKFHTTAHLEQVVNDIRKQMWESNDDNINWESLILAAYFHDVVYLPDKNDNEEKSIEKMMGWVINPTDKTVLLAKDIILDTKIIKDKIGVFNIFQNADCKVLTHSNFKEILAYEKKIFEEFQRFSWDKYQTGRMQFLRKMAQIFTSNDATLLHLVEYVNSQKPRIGIYAGSFNPFTVGHLNVLEKAENIFDKVVVAFGTNPDKDERTYEIPENIQSRECVVYNGLLTDLLKKYEKMGCEVTLVRGLRNEHDLNYEQNLIQYMKDIMPSLKVVLFLCDKEFEHVSSGAIRSLEKVGAIEATKRYLVI